ncbi:hypothetical protein OU995_22165 [Roseateles sp. SL47]|uniref:STY0301 family protein n=1 Tax=Roseateles sp. SL47 TaxID=2995138 RepID=UPI002270D115|nr:STY0301 family protein [Roseateles sp. SL47]WAC72238.1 hypothetical protein OU995_22165 [Roseateles sp. SL47]
MSRSLSGAIVLVLFVSSQPAWAASEPFSCPQQLPPTHQQPGEVPPGFTPGQETAKHVLDGFRINEGPLDVRAGAIYEQVTTKKDGKGGVIETVIWSVPAAPGALAICGYSSTNVVLTRSLDGYKQCSMVSRKPAGGLMELQTAGCR